MINTNDHILIIGAGLSGTLLAVLLAQRGFKVSLVEKRPDMRLVEMDAGRSINLALSNRGIRSLAKAGMDKEILETCIPMPGRLIHDKLGDTFFSPYSGRADEYINSVSREGLNTALLHKADSFNNLTIQFDTQCTHVELEEGIAHFKRRNGSSLKMEADLIIGTDGAGSAVRRSMMGRTTDLLFNYSQDFLRHGYKELAILPGEGGSFKIEKNALHIWPRGHYMVIALPNLDGSFTVTMFHPFEGREGFNTLNTKEKVQVFFEEEYPDLVTHMPNLLDDYFMNPVGTLGTIKCYPWQAFGKALVIGDAAHAVVPFYGQGMNASFEDARVFDEMLDGEFKDWESFLNAYQDVRKQDADAIGDLAVENFYEMRDKVADPVFIRKRKLERQLEETFPDYYSKYSMVTFKDQLGYHEAKTLGNRQDEVLMDMCQDESVFERSLESVLEELRSRI
jgi:kynurenine 3-monooxygenase